MSKRQLYIKLSNILSNRLLQANKDGNFDRLVEINEIIFHIGDALELFDEKFNKRLWRDYIDMIVYNVPLKDKSEYK